MVDANAGLREFSVARQTAESPADAGLEVRVLEECVARGAYSEACLYAVHAPPQSPAWVESWAANGASQLVALLTKSDAPVMALALEVEDVGPFRIARFVGGSHANGNFPAVNREAAAHLDGETLEMMGRAIGRARPDLDMLLLERLLPDLDGMANPLLSLTHRPSPNITLATRLDGGFDALLARVNGKRKRKKYRSQLRKFEETGGFRRFRASSAEEIETVLAAFFAMKAQRFAEQGIADVFADEGVKAAFRNVYVAALGAPSPQFFLEALEVGGKIRAVTGSSRQGSRVVCDFCAFAHDELASTSPGDFLFYENIQEACEKGATIYDFSVGEERYKRAWCDIETAQFDVCLPLTLKGQLLARAQGAVALTKRVVKNNGTLFGFAKRLRRARHGAPADEAE